MSWQLVFADSELAAIERQGAELRLRFSAAQLRQGAQARYARGLVLLLELAEGGDDDTAPHGLFGTVEAGQLQLEGQRFTALGLGQRLTGALQLELQLRRGPTWSARAQALRLPPLEGLVLQEDWAC